MLKVLFGRHLFCGTSTGASPRLWNAQNSNGLSIQATFIRLTRTPAAHIPLLYSCVMPTYTLLHWEWTEPGEGWHVGTWDDRVCSA
jgi:hypothetical protein